MTMVPQIPAPLLDTRPPGAPLQAVSWALREFSFCPHHKTLLFFFFSRKSGDIPSLGLPQLPKQGEVVCESCPSLWHFELLLMDQMLLPLNPQLSTACRTNNEIINRFGVGGELSSALS